MHKRGRDSLPQHGRTRNFRSDSVVVVLISSYLLLVFLVPVVLSAVVSYRALPRSAGCPVCGRDTVPLHRRWLRVVSTLVPRARLQRRWCLECGWEGLARPRTQSMPVLVVEAAPPRRTDTSLDLRSLRVDGRTWRVQLQCWRDQRLCYGRLVFIEPTGRTWEDVLQAFSGTTQFEVLGQALSIPDRTLANRLRQLLIAES